MKRPRFIVAEVSKSWVNGVEVAGQLLSKRFEHVIDVNLKHGYRLASWNAHSAAAVIPLPCCGEHLATPTSDGSLPPPSPDPTHEVNVTETIIAVFELVEGVS